MHNDTNITYWHDIPLVDLQDMSKALWESIRSHPSTSSCECPTAAALAVLLKKGYKLRGPVHTDA